MIYGFGTREYLAAGYKAELTTGYSWGEFNDALYLGTSYETGGFSKLGYIMGGFTLGSYIDLDNGMWQRSALARSAPNIVYSQKCAMDDSASTPGPSSCSCTACIAR